MLQLKRDIKRDARIATRKFIRKIEALIKTLHTKDTTDLHISDRVIHVAQKYITLKAEEYRVKGTTVNQYWSTSWGSLETPDSYFDCELILPMTNFGNEQVIVHVYVIAAEVVDAKLDNIVLKV